MKGEICNFQAPFTLQRRCEILISLWAAMFLKYLASKC